MTTTHLRIFDQLQSYSFVTTATSRFNEALESVKSSPNPLLQLAVSSAETYIVPQVQSAAAHLSERYPSAVSLLDDYSCAALTSTEHVLASSSQLLAASSQRLSDVRRSSSQRLSDAKRRIAETPAQAALAAITLTERLVDRVLPPFISDASTASLYELSSNDTSSSSSSSSASSAASLSLIGTSTDIKTSLFFAGLPAPSPSAQDESAAAQQEADLSSPSARAHLLATTIAHRLSSRALHYAQPITGDLHKLASARAAQLEQCVAAIDAFSSAIRQNLANSTQFVQQNLANSTQFVQQNLANSTQFVQQNLSSAASSVAKKAQPLQQLVEDAYLRSPLPASLSLLRGHLSAAASACHAFVARSQQAMTVSALEDAKLRFFQALIEARHAVSAQLDALSRNLPERLLPLFTPVALFVSHFIALDAPAEQAAVPQQAQEQVVNAQEEEHEQEASTMTTESEQHVIAASISASSSSDSDSHSDAEEDPFVEASAPFLSENQVLDSSIDFDASDIQMTSDEDDE